MSKPPASLLRLLRVAAISLLAVAATLVDGFRVSFTIKPDAPAEPVYVQIVAQTILPGGITPSSSAFSHLLRTSTDRDPFYISNPGPLAAPRLTAVTPATVARGPAPVPVVLTGLNFDASATVLADPNLAETPIIVSDVTFEPSDGSLRAMLTVPENTPTGIHYLAVKTSAARSDVLPLQIIGATPPQTQTPFPNYGAPGSNLVTLYGGAFSTGTQVVAQPADKVSVEGDAEIIDRTNLRVPVKVKPAVLAPADGTLQVLTTGGTSAVGPFFLKPRGFPGPRITKVTPDRLLFLSTDVQLEITGVNFNTSVPNGVFGLPNEIVRFPFPPANSYLLPRSTPSPTRVTALVNLDYYDTRPGKFDLAIRTADGLTTNTFPMEIVDPFAGNSGPLPGRPVVLGARRDGGGGVPRGGGPVNVVIRGGYLAGATAIRFKHPGLSAIITDNSFGNFLYATVTADESTPLSGDQPTYFHVYTRGGESNLGSLLVVE